MSSNFEESPSVPRQNTSSRIHPCHCLIPCIIFTVFSLVGGFILIGIIDSGRDPTFVVEQASVHGFNLTTDGHLTSIFDLTIRAHNRYHLSNLYYSRVQVSISKDNQNLVEDTIQDFYQGKQDITVVKVDAEALDMKLKKRVAQQLRDEIESGFIELDVFMTAALNIDIELKVICRNVVIKITNYATYTMSASMDTQDFHKVSCQTYVKPPPPPPPPPSCQCNHLRGAQNNGAFAA